ncbi:MAG: hypothetical protein ACM3SP_18690 [Chloroflexota bacterium]
MKITKKKAARRKRIPACPECAATTVVPIIHGIPTRAAQKLIGLGKAIRADREEWEGLAEWHCKACGCDWSRYWRRFKIPGGVNATRSER